MWRRLESQSGSCLWLLSLTHYRTQCCTCSGVQQMVLRIDSLRRVPSVFVLPARLSQTRLIPSITQASRTLLTYVVAADGADMSGLIIADDRLLWVQMSVYTQSGVKSYYVLLRVCRYSVFNKTVFSQPQVGKKSNKWKSKHFFDGLNPIKK